MSTDHDHNQDPLVPSEGRSVMARRALIGSGVAVGAAALVALKGGVSLAGHGGRAASASSVPDTMMTDTSDAMAAETTAAASGSGDLGVAALAAGLEVLAVSTYQQALDAAGTGALGEVPPAVSEYVTTALAHHQSHLEAWNLAITDNGGTAVTEPNATLAPVVTEMFGAVTDVAGAAMLALELETIAAHTYLSAIPLIQSPEYRGLAGSIQIIDQQHQSVLLFALGEYPVPEVFQSTDKAVAA